MCHCVLVMDRWSTHNTQRARYQVPGHLKPRLMPGAGPGALCDTENTLGECTLASLTPLTLRHVTSLLWQFSFNDRTGPTARAVQALSLPRSSLVLGLTSHSLSSMLCDVKANVKATQLATVNCAKASVELSVMQHHA